VRHSNKNELLLHTKPTRTQIQKKKRNDQISDLWLINDIIAGEDRGPWERYNQPNWVDIGNFGFYFFICNGKKAPEELNGSAMAHL